MGVLQLRGGEGRQTGIEGTGLGSMSQSKGAAVVMGQTEKRCLALRNTPVVGLGGALRVGWRHT